MMLAKRDLKRTLASLLAGELLVGLLPTAAFAAEQTSWQQIEGEEFPVYYSYDAEEQTWTQADGATVSNSPAAGVPEVRVSKTIQGTDEENVFDITLEVETDQKIQTTTSSPDAAVVLVLDLSSSMDYCAECGWSDRKSVV